MRVSCAMPRGLIGAWRLQRSLATARALPLSGGMFEALRGRQAPYRADQRAYGEPKSFV